MSEWIKIGKLIQRFELDLWDSLLTDNEDQLGCYGIIIAAKPSGDRKKQGRYEEKNRWMGLWRKRVWEIDWLSGFPSYMCFLRILESKQWEANFYSLKKKHISSKNRMASVTAGSSVLRCLDSLVSALGQIFPHDRKITYGDPRYRVF